MKLNHRLFSELTHPEVCNFVVSLIDIISWKTDIILLKGHYILEICLDNCV